MIKISYCSKENGLEIVRGTTNSFGITVLDEDGNNYSVEDGDVLVFGLKRNERDEERVLVKKITSSVTGEHYLEIQPEDTKNLATGQYYYDIGLQRGSFVFYNIIKSSPFIILPNVTKLGDGA